MSKMPLEMLASHTGMAKFKHQVCSLLQLSAHGHLWEAAGASSSSWVLLPMWETWTEFLAPIQPGPVPAAVGIQRVSQQMVDL